jgi:hypothetical protein
LRSLSLKYIKPSAETCSVFNHYQRIKYRATPPVASLAIPSKVTSSASTTSSLVSKTASSPTSSPSPSILGRPPMSTSSPQPIRPSTTLAPAIRHHNSPLEQPDTPSPAPSQTPGIKSSTSVILDPASRNQDRSWSMFSLIPLPKDS